MSNVPGFFFPKILFIFREKGREGETSMCGCLSHTPYWRPGLQPRHVPWPGISNPLVCRPALNPLSHTSHSECLRFYCLCAFLGFFMISSLTFKSLIHFELILVCGVRRWSSFILFHISVQFFYHHLLKKLSLAHCIFCLLCQMLTTKKGVYFWAPFFCSIDLCLF